ncbi:ribosome biogenesis regulatory protein homolog [Protopterus annectens]|uniref:ribosome biogenesis regulatory protein homolog n=1 Tax=Protopterus annectens TaxID=7888 RepID=UPI001CFC0720|nr:ribosome biogenesis regulatory protein homolog [Protopterus annectens]
MAASSVEDMLAKVEREEAEKRSSINVHKSLDLEFDLGNLLATDKNSIDIREFSKSPKGEFLCGLARDNTQLLIASIWQLPIERVEEAVVANLPDPTTRLPQEKPVPKAKPLTRWEQFAKLKGLQKKKTNLVWDEVSKEWKRRWGYNRAKDNTKEWLIEVPDKADPIEDQFAKRIKAKKERVAKNELNRLRNIARSQKIKIPGTGLPPSSQPSKIELGKALHIAKMSTASVGKFQDKLVKEKEPRNIGRKRKCLPVIGDFSAEKQEQLEKLKLMDNKKTKVDVTKAVNKQMREEDAASAALRRKKVIKGRRGKDKRHKGAKQIVRHRFILGYLP